LTGRRDRGCCCSSVPDNGSAYCCDLDGDGTFSGCSQEYQLQWGSMQFGLFNLGPSGSGWPDCCQGSWSISKGSTVLERLASSADGGPTCLNMGSAPDYLPKQIGSYTECVGSNVLWYRPFSFSGSLAYQGNGANCLRNVSDCGKPVPCECSDCLGNNSNIDYGAFGSTQIKFGLVALSCNFPIGSTCSTGKYFELHFKFHTGLCLNGQGANCPQSQAGSCLQIPSFNDWQPGSGGPYSTNQFCSCNSNVDHDNFCGCKTYGGFIKYRTPLLQAVSGSGSNRPIQCPGGQVFSVHSWSGGGTASGSIALIPL